MNIELHEITIRDLYDGYVDSDDEGTVGYHGLLNIRPAYQRAFIYDEPEKKAVIDTVLKGFPLNVMYWVRYVDPNDGITKYELLDGQQRTVSICKFIDGKFHILKNKDIAYFHKGLQDDERKKILDYKLMVYICEGSDSEKLDWFRTINIAGEELSQQELRNAMYTGKWLHDAKRYFSKGEINAPAYRIGKNLINKKVNRQEYLELAIKWMADAEGIKSSKNKDAISQYMAEHQLDKNAMDLWLYYKGVIDWVNTLYKTTRKEMKGLEWGLIYNKYHNNTYDPDEIEAEIKELMLNDEVQNKKGIFEYVLTKHTLADERLLNLREFDDTIKDIVYQEQKGICPICEEHFEIDEMDADHIVPWSQGGKTVKENCKMLCKHCNRTKSDK